MPNYTFVCDKEHSTDLIMTFSEWDEHCKVSKDEVGRVVEKCHHPVEDHECGLNAIRQFTSNDVIYNAPGFYGNIPTICAHNSGQV